MYERVPLSSTSHCVPSVERDNVNATASSGLFQRTTAVSASRSTETTTAPAASTSTATFVNVASPVAATPAWTAYGKGVNSEPTVSHTEPSADTWASTRCVAKSRTSRSQGVAARVWPSGFRVMGERRSSCQSWRLSRVRLWKTRLPSASAPK